MSDYHGNGKLGFERNITILTLQIERLEERVKELETELYFCNRNKRIGEVVYERTKMETPKLKM